MLYPYVKEIIKQNKGNIQLVLRYAPFHKSSIEVVKILETTKKQDKFIETLELMFITHKYWVKNHAAKLDILWEILSRSNTLDMDKLLSDMKDSKLDTIIKQDLADAKVLGANKTPSYFVNGKPLETFGFD